MPETEKSGLHQCHPSVHLKIQPAGLRMWGCVRNHRVRMFCGTGAQSYCSDIHQNTHPDFSELGKKNVPTANTHTYTTEQLALPLLVIFKFSTKNRVIRTVTKRTATLNELQCNAHTSLVHFAV